MSGKHLHSAVRVNRGRLWGWDPRPSSQFLSLWPHAEQKKRMRGEHVMGSSPFVQLVLPNHWESYLTFQ